MIEFFQDDIALVVCMITILAFTCLVVIFKVSFQGFSGDFNGFIQRFMLVATLELMQLEALQKQLERAEPAIFQVSVLDEKPNMNISTFRPQGQKINDNKKYNGFGYIPCNGYVPCQVFI